MVVDSAETSYQRKQLEDTVWSSLTNCSAESIQIIQEQLECQLISMVSNHL